MTERDRTLIRASDYRVVSLASGYTREAAVLNDVLRDRHETVPDPKRQGFYWVEGGRNRFYVNVHDRTRTIYLVAVAPAPPLEALAPA